MGRHVKVRVSYQSDATYLMRLKQAIEEDVRQSTEWRRECVASLNTVIAKFLEHTKNQILGQDKKKKVA